MNEGAVALLLAAATIAGVLVGIRVQAREDERGARIAPARGRDLWVPAWLLALGVAFAGVAMLGLARPLRDWADREHLFLRRPVAEVRITRRPEESGAAWRVPRGTAVMDAQVGAGAGGARGRDGALRLRVDLRTADDAAAVQVSGTQLPAGIAVATVWVYVEASDAAQGAGLHARLYGRMNAGPSGSFSLLGERTALTPGAWTEVAWAGSYTLELSPALGEGGERRVRASDRLTSLGVQVEADRPFRGAVFVDDLRMYSGRP